jgi:hypothetical protein
VSVPTALLQPPPYISRQASDSDDRVLYERNVASVLQVAECINIDREQYQTAAEYYLRLQYRLSTPALVLGVVVTMGASLQLEQLPVIKYGVVLLAALNTLLVALMQHWKVEASAQAHHNTGKNDGEGYDACRISIP